MVQPAQPGTDLAVQSDFATGLEDFDASDLRMPRLTINHENGTFVDSLSKGEYSELTVITLGLIKQRVLWPAQVAENNSNPMCKAPDHKTGYPTLEGNRDELFPWQATPGWTPQSFPADEEGRIQLPCDSCRLKDWGSHPDGKKTWCSEQHAVPLLYGIDGGEPAITALFTTQRSSINSTKAFFGAIKRRELPAFAVMATLKLNPQTRGKNTYYVPVFIESGPTDQGNWSLYSENYQTIRKFVQRPPRRRGDDNGSGTQFSQMANTGGVAANNTWVPGQVVDNQPAQQQQPAQPAQQYQQQPAQQYQQQPAQQYQQPVQQQVYQQPVQQQPVQQQPVQQAAPPMMPAQPAQPQVQQPVQQQFAPQLPVQPPVQQQVQQPAQPAPQPATGRDNSDDDLPF